MTKQAPRKVVLISTGGTISSNRNAQTGLLTSGVISGEELSRMCELPDDIKVDLVSAFQLPSNQVTFEHLLVLKERIEEVFEDQDVDGIVVTHGTDTLEETAYFLDLTIDDPRPVVITGSQRSPSALGTDAFVNLRQSILLAASAEGRNLGTLALFNEKILPARHIKKDHASNVDGFTSTEFGNMGMVDQDEVILYRKAVERETYKLSAALPYVEIVKCSLGSDGRLIEHAADLGAKGIVVEAFGRGHVPPSVVDSVKYAIQKGVVVILTTSVAEGRVKVIYDTPGTAYDLQKAGVILGRDFDSKKARMKLAVMLAAGVGNIEEVF